jgi:hypothetical protein
MATTNYSTARQRHEGVLKAAKANVDSYKNRDHAGWIIINVLLTAVAPWAGRILTPVAEKVAGKIKDKLTLDWAKDALSGPRVQAAVATAKDKAKSGAESLWDAFKDTAIGSVSKHAGSTNDTYEPVAPQSIDFSARLKAGIRGRSIPLRESINELTKKQHTISIPAAKAIYSGFHYSCPFVTDLPADLAEDDTSFQRDAELEMWVDWGLSQDAKWWRGEGRSDLGKLGPVVVGTDPKTIARRVALKPILDELLALGVPSYKVSSEVPFNGPKGPIFDMVKFIEWAQRKRSPITIPAALDLGHYEQVCRLPKPGTPQNVCPVK